MTDFRSLLNTALRRAAGILPTNSPLRNWFSRRWTSILSKTGVTVEVPVGGRSIRVPNSNRQLDPTYEAETLALWQKLIRDGDTVWDVGANIGVYSVISGMAVGAMGRVVSWEPTPKSYEILNSFITANGLETICHTENAAIGAIPGIISFRIFAESTDPTNRISISDSKLAPGEVVGKVVLVPIDTLDNWLTRLRVAPHIVKIDIEGAELLALRGASALMSQGGPRPYVLLAVHPMFLPEFGATTEMITELIRGYGYTTYTIDGRSAQELEYSEYLLIPIERDITTRKSLGWMA